MSNKSKPNNGVNETGASSEGLSPSRCSIVVEDGPGHHRTTTDRRRRRRKWPQEENSSNAVLLQRFVWEKWIQEENACHME